MHDLFSHCLLLAERSRLDHLSEPFRDAPTRIDRELTRALSILAGIIVLVWLLSRVLHRPEHRHAYHGPLRLFLACARPTTCSGPSRWLLWRLARASG